MSLALRPIGENDYSVIDGGNVVGRIRHAAERTNDVWLWHVTVLIPSPPFGSARNLDAAKAGFKEAWTAFKAKVGPGAVGTGVRDARQRTQ